METISATTKDPRDMNATELIAAWEASTVRCACGARDTSTCHLDGYGHGNLCESCHAVGAPVVR